jgi:ATP-dependent Clp protease protease subunit
MTRCGTFHLKSELYAPGRKHKSENSQQPEQVRKKNTPASSSRDHQPSGGMQGQFTEMEISYNLIKTMRDELYEIMAKHTGKTFDQIAKDSDRDNWMTSHQAKEYGLVDEVLTRSK